MSDASMIEWTDATWNPVRGCTRVSTGCGGPRYAEKIAARFSDPGQPFHGFAKRTPNGGAWTGKVALIEDMLTVPMRWKKPRRIFVNSMSDLFHESLPDEAIDRVFAVMALCPQHTFQVLTKRAARMREYFARKDTAARWVFQACQVAKIKSCYDMAAPDTAAAWQIDGLPNVWLGVSAERQEEWDERKEHLRNTPAAVRFASFEPLLGAIREDYTGDYIHWAIVGGESGKSARPMHPQWARDIRDQCEAAGVKFFFKQWGEWGPHKVAPGGDLGGDVRSGRVRIVHPTGQSDVEVSVATGGRNTIPGSRYMARGKKAAGRLLDGREHNGMPEVRG